MEPNNKTSFKCGDVLHKGSSLLSFISLLLIVWLFLRIESINKKTEMNELRISKVESRVETESLQTTDHNMEMETPESKWSTLISNCTTRVSYIDQNNHDIVNWMMHDFLKDTVATCLSTVRGKPSR